ncbi:accessory factor UbiK family protein [Motiliproteus sediminis]|uniref:accessory factor UbiK family protein n=1 Tax=Motiliproteus sediminis TaxID=1468178 RepID=UPI001AEF95DC|nr:accessory factor UbiK family protein [Motiliproteus sediminis]
MISHKLLETLNQQFTQLVGEGPQKTQEEIRRSVNLILQGALSRLDLVTREEFDTQSEVLMRTRQLVEQLDARLAELESADHDTPERGGTS